MKRHVRLQGTNRYSFRIRALDQYIDAGASYETEDDAAFAADLAKHYLRSTYFIDLELSLDPDLFATMAHRHNVVLSDGMHVRTRLSPGVDSFIASRWVALDKHAQENRPVLKDWEKLQFDPSYADWVHKCQAADVVSKEYRSVNSESFFTRLSVVDRSLDASLKSLALAVRLHGDPVPAALIVRVTDLRRLIEHLMQTQDYVRELTTRLKREEHDATTALEKLESERPKI